MSRPLALVFARALTGALPRKEDAAELGARLALARLTWTGLRGELAVWLEESATPEPFVVERLRALESAAIAGLREHLGGETELVAFARLYRFGVPLESLAAYRRSLSRFNWLKVG